MSETDTTNTTGDASIVSKLTAKALGNPKLGSESRHFLGTIRGIATGAKVKVDQSGNAFEAILGSFEGVRGKDGMIMNSAMLYLPGGIHEMISEPVKRATLDAEGKPIMGSLTFSIDLFTIPSTNAAGYSYEAISNIPIAKTDPFAELRQLEAAKRQERLRLIEDKENTAAAAKAGGKK
jgi:hypothetical protein